VIALGAAQFLATFIAIHQNVYHRGSYFFSLPFGIAILLLLGPVHHEAERWKAERARRGRDTPL